jgi:hypothetical protein
LLRSKITPAKPDEAGADVQIVSLWLSLRRELSKNETFWHDSSGKEPEAASDSSGKEPEAASAGSMEEPEAVEVAERNTSARVRVRRVRVRKANKADAVDEDGKTLLYRSAQSVVVCTVGFPVSFRSTLSEVRLLTRGPPREESSGPFSAHYRTLQR